MTRPYIFLHIQFPKLSYLPAALFESSELTEDAFVLFLNCQIQYRIFCSIIIAKNSSFIHLSKQKRSCTYEWLYQQLCMNTKAIDFFDAWEK